MLHDSYPSIMLLDLPILTIKVHSENRGVIIASYSNILVYFAIEPKNEIFNTYFIMSWMLYNHQTNDLELGQSATMKVIDLVKISTPDSQGNVWVYVPPSGCS